MKYIHVAFIALLFAGCKSSQGDVTITGTAAGTDFGNVAVKDHGYTTTLFSTDIESGKFNLGKQYLQYSGYYSLSYASNAGKSQSVEIYLEPGTYNIKLDFNNINNYPVITSSSKIQQELSAYHAVSDSINAVRRTNVVALNNQIRGLKDKLLKPGEYTEMVSELQGKELDANQVDEVNDFGVFMKKYPNNEIAAHLMLKINYQSNPVAYYNLFKKFSPDAKNSDDGKELESKLKQLARLASGGTAPNISGETPDGKSVDIKALNKKIMLLDFWRSANTMSRENHPLMISGLLTKYGSRGFGIVSVSLDTDRGKWTSAIAADHMNWPQLSDLKGDDSPNAENWGIKSIPTYYLLNGSGHIITHITEFSNIDAAVSDYLAKH